MKNPYATDRIKPSLCYGRDDLLKELRGESPGDPKHIWQSFGIAGGRRMGKTTLLRRVEQDLLKGIEEWKSIGRLVIPIYMDCMALPDSNSLSADDIWGILFRELQSALEDQAQQLKPLDFDNFKKKVEPILCNLEEEPLIIVMFDEIERVLVCDWSNGFLDNWRALLSNTPNLAEYFTAVFSGAQEMEALQHDVTSPLANVLKWRPLHSLAYTDACQLMQDPIDHQWPEPFLERVYKETGGHPMLLQCVMQHICQEPPKKADQSLEQIIKKIANDHRWQFSQWWERYCSPMAQRVYRRLPDDGTMLPLETLTDEFDTTESNNAVEILQHVGLIATEKYGLCFRYSGEIFRQWFRRYAKSAKSSGYDPRGSSMSAKSFGYDPDLYSRLADVNSDLAKKYLAAWKIYDTKSLPNYSGAIHEMRDGLTYLLDEIAPDEDVRDEEGFTLEPGTASPTRRQRIRYAARRKLSRERTKEIVSDYELLETVTTRAYRRASGMAHTTATREEAYPILKQWDSIFAQLIQLIP